MKISITAENESKILIALQQFYKSEIVRISELEGIGSLRQLSIQLGYDPGYIEQVMKRGKFLRLKKVYDKIKKIG